MPALHFQIMLHFFFSHLHALLQFRLPPRIARFYLRHIAVSFVLLCFDVHPHTRVVPLDAVIAQSSCNIVPTIADIGYTMQVFAHLSHEQIVGGVQQKQVHCNGNVSNAYVVAANKKRFLQEIV